MDSSRSSRRLVQLFQCPPTAASLTATIASSAGIDALPIAADRPLEHTHRCSSVTADKCLQLRVRYASQAFSSGLDLPSIRWWLSAARPAALRHRCKAPATGAHNHSNPICVHSPSCAFLRAGLSSTPDHYCASRATESAPRASTIRATKSGRHKTSPRRDAAHTSPAAWSKANTRTANYPAPFRIELQVLLRLRLFDQRLLPHHNHNPRIRHMKPPLIRFHVVPNLRALRQRDVPVDDRAPNPRMPPDIHVVVDDRVRNFASSC